MDTEESEVWRRQLLEFECEKVTTTDTLDVGEIIIKLYSITGNRKVNGEYPKLVLKRSWKRKDAPSEFDSIRKVRSMPSICKNIVKVFTHGTAQDDSAAQRFMEAFGMDLSSLHLPKLMLMEQCQPVWMLNEVSFWEVVTQLIKCTSLHLLPRSSPTCHRLLTTVTQVFTLYT